MPTQDLRQKPQTDFPRSRFSAAGRVRAARILVFFGALLLAAFGTNEMIAVVSVGDITVFKWAVVVLFAITFGWISLAATSAIAGVIGRFRRLALPASALAMDKDIRVARPTVLLMPVYNEAPGPVFAGLRAMAEDLAAQEALGRFEIFIISDTTNPDIWIAEEATFDRFRHQVPAGLKVWYRRRPKNTDRKAGNVADFVRHWGSRYERMVVLDADSLMAGETLVRLERAMLADPTAGIIQTVPRIIGGTTVFARVQQFAGRIYGPVVSRGLAAWQGRDGNYWGHNAIIRVRAFADAAGLPHLKGPRPIGGSIMSHDFVEAALIRRAGWSVTMLPEEEGSYEESPPSLIDVSIRDRRWAQGNLQHLGVLFAAGLRWPSRMHFTIGILSYLMSPIWLALLLTGFGLAVQASFAQPNYFTGEFSLFPNWPQFDTPRMIRLFVISMSVLLLPKVIGIGLALSQRAVRRGCGGSAMLILSALLEVLLSALFAPIMMLLQTRHVFEILIGRDAGWSPQRRADGGLPFREIVDRHISHVLLGFILAGVAYMLVPSMAAWMAPTAVGLVLAIPVSAMSASRKAGQALARLSLLRIPEESAPPVLLTRARALRDETGDAEMEDGLMAIVDDPDLRAVHDAMMVEPPRRRGHPEVATATASLKIEEARHYRELAEWLTRAERMAILSDRALVSRVLALPREPEDSEPSPHEVYAEHPRLQAAVGAD